MDLIITSLIFSIGFNLLVFVPAYFLKTDKLTDLSYSLTFFVLAFFLYWNSSQDIVHLLLLLMILIWSIRLGVYLFIRINKTKRDRRFDGIRESFTRFIKFWLLQGLSVWIILFASINYFSIPNLEFSNLHILGLSIWFIGLLIETVADYQKFVFKSKPENKEHWTNVGLWNRSRHPNYFGEILVWVGIYLFTIVNKTDLLTLIALISPIYIIFILMFVSGVPLLEKKYNEKFKDNPEYQKYKAKTNLIILK